MNNLLTKKQLNSIILFQRRYRILKMELKQINEELNFYNCLLTEMSENMEYCGKLNLYIDSDDNFTFLENQLTEIKDLMFGLPEIVYIKDLKYYKLEDIHYAIYRLRMLIREHSNNICTHNFYNLFDFFFGTNWANKLGGDYLKLIFITKFMRPVNIWSSGLRYPPRKEKQTPRKRNRMLTQDFITSIIEDSSNKCSKIIVGDNGGMPVFLKSIDALLNASKEKAIRDNTFDIEDCVNTLSYSFVEIKKNKKSNNLYEEKYGACVYIYINNEYYVIQGVFNDDVLGLSYKDEHVKQCVARNERIIKFNNNDIPLGFKRNFIKTMNLRDLVTTEANSLMEVIKYAFDNYNDIVSTELNESVTGFMVSSKHRKNEILTLLLIGSQDDQKIAYILFESLKKKNKQLSNEIFHSLHHYVRELLDKAENDFREDEQELNRMVNVDIPYEQRINVINSSDSVKAKAMEKLKSMKNNMSGDNKAQTWLDGLLKIPFGVYSENDILSFKNNFIVKVNEKYNINLKSENQITNFINDLRDKTFDDELVDEWNNYLNDRVTYLQGVRKTLDDAVYGHKDAKKELERLFAQWINGETKGTVIGLEGPPGVGKTSLAKNGLSKCLIDKNNKPRAFSFLGIGGSVNASTLVGHNFTYVSSTWGKIVDILIDSKCMNPIIFIDELDKVSTTDHGREIISILTHLTDSTQNDEFEDKYFAGVKLDLSKALIVFSFNDRNLIDPILKDRIKIIETKPLTLEEKITIIRDYTLPEILEEIGFYKDEIIIDDDLIKYIIETYTLEAGVRKVKEKMYEIIRDINLNRFHNPLEYPIPFVVTEEYISKLFEDHKKVRIKKIHDEPKVGYVNGLYATNAGTGGITIVQVMRYHSDKFLELNVTGKLGEVMKESVEYSKNIAFNLLTDEEKNKLINEYSCSKLQGLHLHFPEASTPKDGPSAGCAITLAIYSLLTNKRIDNKVALTGEIDLDGKACPIGGVYEKLNGAKKAGVIRALIPRENYDEELIRLRNDGISPEDDNFQVLAIDNINDVIRLSILD